MQAKKGQYVDKQKIRHVHAQGTLFRCHPHPLKITSSIPPRWMMQDQLLKQQQRAPPGADRMQAWNEWPTGQDKKLPGGKRLCQLHADFSIPGLAHLLQPAQQQCRSKYLHGCPERSMAQPPSWGIQQVSPLQSHPNEPSPVGGRDQVVTKITTQQIRNVSPMQHLAHPSNLNDKSAGAMAMQWQSVGNVLLHPLH